MALINGNDYDHIDFTKNGVTTRHMLKDTLSRQMSGDLVKVQNEEPTSEGTKIWIKPSGDSEVQVPTYEEFEELSDRVDSINTMSIHICAAQEYDSETGIPTLLNPDLKTFYLVPGGDAPNLYVEWIFTDGRWEQFGSATIDLSNYATKDEIPDVPVQDVQVNGASVLDANGVAEIPMADGSTAGVVIIDTSNQTGVQIRNNKLMLRPAVLSDVKASWGEAKPLTPPLQSASAFYGLAKAAGDATQSQSFNSIGTYTPEAKGAIQKMLGVSDLIAQEENNLTASKAYAIGDIFTANGKLYKATAAIAKDAAIILPDSVGANCVETTIAESGGKIKDVQVAGTSIIENGVANIPYAIQSSNGGIPGLMSCENGSRGIYMYGLNGNVLSIYPASAIEVKAGSHVYKPLTPSRQHESIFYGLAKAAGDTTQSASDNVVGQYTSEAKAAIKAMLGVEEGLKVVRLI